MIFCSSEGDPANLLASLIMPLRVAYLGVITDVGRICQAVLPEYALLLTRINPRALLTTSKLDVMQAIYLSFMC
jgi:hypothetical protein